MSKIFAKKINDNEVSSGSNVFFPDCTSISAADYENTKDATIIKDDWRVFSSRQDALSFFGVSDDPIIPDIPIPPHFG